MTRAMIRLFPTLDSLLLALAVFAASGCLVFLVGGKAADPGRYAMISAGLILVPLAYLGRRRGHNNLDGVFIGPTLRLLALVTLVGAGGLWLGLWLSTPDTPPPCSGNDCTPNPRPDDQRSEDCKERLARAERVLSELKTFADGKRDGLADNPTFRVTFNTVENSDAGLGTCSGREITDHVGRRDALMNDLREYYDQPPRQPLAQVADAITKAPARTAAPASPTYKVEKGPPTAPGAPPTVYVVVPDPVQPPLPPAGSPGSSGSGTGNPPPRTQRFEYKQEFRPSLLGILLSALGLGFTKISVEEVEGAMAEVKRQNSGKPLDDLFARKNVTPAERDAFIQKLVAVGYLEEAAGSDWNKSVTIYVSGRLETALCLAISREIGILVTAPNTLDLNEALNRRNNLSPQDRSKIDDEVHRCLKNLSGNGTERALPRYDEIVRASGG